MRTTAKAQLIERLLGRDLPTYLDNARQAGKGWRRIAAEIREETKVPVSHETLRNWDTGCSDG